MCFKGDNQKERERDSPSDSIYDNGLILICHYGNVSEIVLVNLACNTSFE